MPHSVLPVTFDMLPTTASQITARNQITKPSVSREDDNYPQETFADHLQKSQEAVNSAKKKASSRQSADEQTRADSRQQIGDSKRKNDSKIEAPKAHQPKGPQAKNSDVKPEADNAGEQHNISATTDISEITQDDAHADEIGEETRTETIDTGLLITDNTQTPEEMLLAPVIAVVHEPGTETNSESIGVDLPEDILLQETISLPGVNESLGNENINSDSQTYIAAELELSVEPLTPAGQVPITNGTQILHDTVALSNASPEQESSPLMMNPASLVGNPSTSTKTTPLTNSVPEIFSFSEKSGMNLPIDDGVIVSESSELIDGDVSVDDLNELLFKSDEKNNKTEQFKLLMGQSVAKEQPIPLEKPAAQPLVHASLQSVATDLAPAARLFVPQTQLGMNAGHPQWGKAVGEKILWMASQQLSSADIRLDPPELGSLQVKVTVQQDQASITFVSPHPQVRELLDQQAVRLRELFADQGLTLSHMDIADRHQQSGDSQGNSQSSRQFAAEESDEEVMQTPVSSLYLVDLHA